VPRISRRTTEIAEADALNAQIGSAQRRQLEVIVQLEDSGVWAKDGHRDLAHWLAGRYQMSVWKTRRMIAAGHALRELPLIAAALEHGTLNLDKVLELCRFAQPSTEQKLIRWAQGVTLRTVRQRADVANRINENDVLEADRSRYLTYWWFDDNKRLGLEGSFPADQGALLVKALDRMADAMPDIVSDDGSEPRLAPAESIETRRADALVALASMKVANDQDPDRATVVVHADLAALTDGLRSCEIEGGPAIHPEVAKRLLCDGRLQVVTHDDDGTIVGVSETGRTVSARLMRQLRHRDRECLFPGCDARRFLYAHHVVHWPGPTRLDNLALVCGFHHKLVHERGWDMALGPPGMARWFRPNGSEYHPVPNQLELPGRAPPQETPAFA
jgi:hypothetical protein